MLYHIQDVQRTVFIDPNGCPCASSSTRFFMVVLPPPLRDGGGWDVSIPSLWAGSEVSLLAECGAYPWLQQPHSTRVRPHVIRYATSHEDGPATLRHWSHAAHTCYVISISVVQWDHEAALIITSWFFAMRKKSMTPSCFLATKWHYPRSRDFISALLWILNFVQTWWTNISVLTSEYLIHQSAITSSLS